MHSQWQIEVKCYHDSTNKVTMDSGSLRSGKGNSRCGVI